MFFRLEKKVYTLLSYVEQPKASMNGNDVTCPIGYVIAADNNSEGTDFIETVKNFF